MTGRGVRMLWVIGRDLDLGASMSWSVSVIGLAISA
jgi:hypothetical protein